MNPVNKILFNALVSRRSVALPGVGTLVFERQPARVKGRKQLFPPRSRVVFQTDPLPGAVSLQALIAALAGEGTDPAAVYAGWLADHHITPGRELPARVAIDSVGEIVSGQFNADPALEKLINPLGGRPIALTPRLSGKVIAIATGVAVVLILGAVLYFHRSPEEKQYAYREEMARELERRNLDRAQRGLDVVDPAKLPAATAPAPVPDTARVAVPEIVEVSQPEAKPAPEPAKPLQPETQKPAAQPAAQPAATQTAKPAASATPVVKPLQPETAKPATQTAKPASSPAPAAQTAAAKPAGPLYHVVLGVFSNNENAQKFIGQFKEPGVTCTVVPMGSKFMVSGFSSPEKAQTDARLKELQSKYPDLWVYKK